MKVCTVIEFDIIRQQVIYVQGYKSAKSILKNFKKGEWIYEMMELALDDYDTLRKECNGWVHTIDDLKTNTMLPVVIMSEVVDVTDPKSLSVLAHELIHVIQKIRGKFFEKGDVEFEAYSYEYLFFNILKSVTNK